MMKRRKFLKTTTALTVSGLASPASLALSSRTASLKKGWAGGSGNIHKKFGCHWYYNWSAWPGSSGCEYIPMVKGQKEINAGHIGKVKSFEKVPNILSFNEPERPDQANMPLDKVLEAWPKLQKLAEEKQARLGSIAPSSNDQGLKYLAAFMKEAKTRKLKVDFIAVHYYRSSDPGDLKSFIRDLAKKYRLPIWLTEFNAGYVKEREHKKFLRSALRFLEREKSVERYAYFNPGHESEGALLKEDGSFTSLGEIYLKAGT